MKDDMLPQMTTMTLSGGRLTLPTEIRELDDIQPGQQFDIERIGPGEYRLKRRQPAPNEGLVDWLLACPEKDFFVPLHFSHTLT